MILSFKTINLFVFIIFFKFSEFLISCQRVKLKDVETITLFKDKLTNGKRLSPVPQLKCIGSYSKCLQFSPHVVQCYNRGHDGIDVQWDCQADLDKRVRFDLLRVTCEGYDYPNDAYVLAGSCGLEYSLESSAFANKKLNEIYQRDYYETTKLSNFLSLLIMIVILLAVYKSCSKNREIEPSFTFSHDFNNVQQSDSVNGGVFPPPPPPYGFATQSNPQAPPAGFKPEYVNLQNSNFETTSNNANVNNTNGSSGNWNNFLTGAAVGGITSYFINRRNWSDASLSARRSDSPPPAYDEPNSRVASGFATTTRR